MARHHFRVLLSDGHEIAAKSLRRDGFLSITAWTNGGHEFDIRVGAITLIFEAIDARPTIPFAKR